MMRSLLNKLWAHYCEALQHRPLLTKASMASVIFFTSDSITQYILRVRDDETEEESVDQNDNDERNESIFRWDGGRAVSAACFGVASTSFLHAWWGFLERVVGARISPVTHRITNTAVKVLLQQTIGAPFYIYSYFVITNFVHYCSREYHSPRVTHPDEISRAWVDVNNKAASMLWPTLLKHWSVWPWVQSFNFYFVPLHHRVLLHNSVLILWSGYLSYLNHHDSVVAESLPDQSVTATENGPTKSESNNSNVTIGPANESSTTNSTCL